MEASPSKVHPVSVDLASARAPRLELLTVPGDITLRHAQDWIETSCRASMIPNPPLWSLACPRG
jgi:hypothetical protein